MGNSLMQRIKMIWIALLGKFSWQPPSWLNKIHFSLGSSQPGRRGLFSFLAVLFLMVLVCLIYPLFQPSQPLIAAEVNTPVNVYQNKAFKATPLQIEFHEFPKGFAYVAPLKQLGKKLEQGINITPALKGRFQWDTEYRLLFQPVDPWPAGENIQVQFSKNLFAHPIRLLHKTVETRTPTLQVSLKTPEFYVDLLDPHIQKLVGTLHFNYPIRPESLKDKLYLSDSDPTLSTRKNHWHEAVSFSTSEDKLEVYISYTLKSLPETSAPLFFVIDKGIDPEKREDTKQQAIGKPSEQVVVKKIMIPDKKNVFKFDQIQAKIIRDKQEVPKQTLLLHSTVGVDTAALKKAIQVYLLPQDYPATRYEGIRKNYTWHNPGEVLPDMLQTPVKLETIPTTHEFDTVHGFSFQAPANRYLYLQINKALLSYGQFPLIQAVQKIIPVPAFPKEIRFLHQGSLLALSGEKKVSLLVRGLPAIKISAARILHDQINHFITQTGGSFQSPYFLNTFLFNANNISKIFEEEQLFNNSDSGKVQYTTLDIENYLKQSQTPNQLGLFLLKIQGWDPLNKLTLSPEVHRLILVTDLALLVKNNQDLSHDVFITSITKGTPVTGASVSVLGKNGLAIMTQQTDNEGHTHFPSFESFKEQNEPVLYLVKKDSDMAFIPFAQRERKLNYSRFDIGGETNENQYGLDAFLFSDRGLYRPGETVHLGMITKNRFAKVALNGLLLELCINDFRGVSVFCANKIPLTANGLLTQDFPTTETMPTGQYSAELYITKDHYRDSLLGSTHFTLSDFEPDTLKMRTDFSPTPHTQEGWVSPDHLSANIQLSNLFGTPAPHRRVSGTLYFAPQVFHFSKYPHYIFMDPLFDPTKPPKIFSEKLTDLETNEKGEAQFRFDLRRFSHATYRLTLEARGYAGNGGRGVTKQNTILVSPLSSLIGFKLDEDLNYIKQKEERMVHFIAVNAALQNIHTENLRQRFVKLNTITTLAQQADKTFRYVSAIQEQTVEEKPFALNEKGASVRLKTDEIGEYKLQILDKDNTLVSQVPYTVVGASQHPVQKNTMLTVKLNKKTYQAGENIELNIQSPYEGVGLITLERDKVYAYKWFKTDKTSQVENISLPKDFLGTGYVNVSFIRDWNSNEIFLNPLSYALEPFSVLPDSSQINIQLTAPEKIRPDQTLPISYQSNQAAKIIVFAVDEGILQVANYVTPNPLNYFFRKRALGVTTTQIVDQILPKYISERELSAVGGDGHLRDSLLMKNLNPFKRKNEKPVVFWSGILDSTTQAKTLQYHVPSQFNGQIRLMAIAVSDNAVGSTEKNTLVQDDIILTPNAPTFVAPGDEFSFSMTVANTQKEESKQEKIFLLTLKVDPTQFESLSDRQQKISLASLSEKTVFFKLRSKNKLGAAKIMIQAQEVGGQSGKIRQRDISLSIRSAQPYQTTLQSGVATKNHTINITRQLFPEKSLSLIRASADPRVLIFGLENFMTTNPFNCTEQLVSRAFVQMMVATQKQNSHQAAFQNVYDDILNLLQQRQTAEGGIAYWPNFPNHPYDDFASLYALHFLTEAKGLGLSVPQTLFNRLIVHTIEFARSDSKDVDSARLHAYAIYLLTRNEVITTNYITNLYDYLNRLDQKNKKDKKEAALRFDWKTDLIGVYLAASYQLMHNTEEANKLIHFYKWDEKKEPDFFDTNLLSKSVQNKLFLAILARHFPEQLKQLGHTVFVQVAESISSDQINTLSAAMSALALGQSALALPAADMSSVLQVSEKLSSGEKHNLKLEQNEAPFSLDASVLHLVSDRATPFYYQVVQSGFDLMPTKTEIKENLEITREYHNAKGEVITQVSIGSEVEVVLRVRALNKNQQGNMAIVDLFPGGFEYVPNSAKEKVNNRASTLLYKEAHEDRIIFHDVIGPDAKEYVYRLRAINQGDFATPPAFALDLYHSHVFAKGITGKIEVK